MKVKITFKDPDAALDPVNDAVNETRPPRLTDVEWKLIKEERVSNEMHKLGKWLEYDEYVVIEFDTDAGTATVIENKG